MNAKLPSEYIEDPAAMPLEEAWFLINEKAAQGPPGRGRKGKKGSKELTSSIELPTGPKRPLSAYLHFCAEKRPEVAASTQSLGATSKELARLWKDVSDEDREPYVKMAADGKVQYEEKKRAWLGECDELLKKHGHEAPPGGRRKGARGGAAARSGPKGPRSAYIFFCSAKREEVSKNYSSLGEISKELGRMWSEASDEDKKEFNDMAAEDKLRYEREKIDGGAETAARKKKLVVTGKKRSSSKKKKRKATTKPKSGPSAYMLFCAAHRNDVVDEHGNKMPLGETTKRLAKMWNECDEETREKFQSESEKQKLMMTT